MVIVSCGRQGPTQIRVQNETDKDFQNVMVGGKTFGDIKSGGVTEYQTFNVAYSYSSVKLVAGTNRMGYYPMDYVGEKPLGRGRFTYLLTIGPDSDLTIRAKKDI